MIEKRETPMGFERRKSENLVAALVLLGISAMMLFAATGAAAAPAARLFIPTPGAPAEEGFPLVTGGAATDILIDANDYTVVHIAAAALAGDIEMVSGARPAVKTSGGGRVVIIGTIEKNPLVRRIAENAGGEFRRLLDKSWESFVIGVVDRPAEGIEEALVIAGSDRRGAAFGAFEVSAMIGVSPWVWWADVAPEKSAEISLPRDAMMFGPPSVKYRGIFLNDEDFGLQPWAAKTFEPETGDIGPKTYARIFELLLRLKANHIWPAMHKCTRAFNRYEADKQVADDYAIVMGSSHCEQMLRNNVDEWDHDSRGKWSYVDNRENLLRYWEERVEANGRFENVYTIGMRAIHDSGMPDGNTREERVAILTDIIRDQRAMLAKRVNPDPAEVPQVFIPYKEVLELYWGGLKLPDDVTIVWPDDNFGYIRRLPPPEDRERRGGHGVYYHISYWGPPHDYLWLNTTPPALIFEEMSKAWENGARRLWMLNVGDIKPHEIGMELFLRMAWDIDSVTLDNIGNYLAKWAAREFGPAHAEEIADVMNRYYTLNYHRKPEHMGFYDKYSILAQNQDPEFSLHNYGDETSNRIADFSRLEDAAKALHDKMPAGKKDAFYQLVLYPVRATAILNWKHLFAHMSRKYARQGRVSASVYASFSEVMFKQMRVETKYYNEEMSGGKWNGMMDDSPNDLPVFAEVETSGVKLPDGPTAPGVAIEGRAQQIKPGAANSDTAKKAAMLPTFSSFTEEAYTITVFNKGAGALDWTATPSDEWIWLSETSGTTESEKKFFARVDYALAPKGENLEGSIEIAAAGEVFTVWLNVFNPEDTDIGGAEFVQDNGVVAIDAVSYLFQRAAGGAAWRVIPGFGRTGSAVAIRPSTAPPVEDLAAARSSAPSLEYTFFVFEPGAAEIILEAPPTHEMYDGRTLRVGVSIDGGGVFPIDFEQAHEETAEIGKMNVQRNAMYGSAKVNIGRGAHKLEIFGVDSSVGLDRIIIDFGGLRKSYLGPEETRVVE